MVKYEEAIIRRKLASQKLLEYINNEDNLRRFRKNVDIIRCEKRKYMRRIVENSENDNGGHRTGELYVVSTSK